VSVPAQAPATSLLSAAARGEIDVWVAKYPADQKQSAVMAALRIAQDEHDGWLSTEIMDAVADYLEMPRIAVYEVATFYSMYELSPVGRHKICVCNSVSCMLNGSEETIAYLEGKLGIKAGQTSADGRYTLKKVECLGACVDAPMAQVGRTYHAKLTPERIDAILQELEQSDGQ
jgi:NADH-quinone oxidoreductase subunit E